MHSNRERPVQLDCEWDADNRCCHCGYVTPVAEARRNCLERGKPVALAMFHVSVVPGSVASNLVAMLGWSNMSCGLRDILAAIDRRGVEWARENEGVIVESLVANAGGNGAELTADGARSILRQAIVQTTHELSCQRDPALPAAVRAVVEGEVGD